MHIQCTNRDDAVNEIDREGSFSKQVGERNSYTNPMGK